MAAMFINDWAQLSENLLQKIGYSYEKPKPLVEAILQLSEYYQNSDSKTTPWDEKWAQAAYISYFWPLNHCRLQNLFEQISTLDFWGDCSSLIDFGAGPAVAAFALPPDVLESYIAIESSPAAKEFYQKLGKRPHFPIVWKQDFSADLIDERSVGLFSYSLNELTTLPSWAEKLSSLILIEPSTNQAGRSLLELRQDLINKGYHAWGPCLHQEKCPLLEHSKKDWCHHRASWVMPKWFQKIDDLLPIKNQTLTYSYLLMNRHPAPPYPERTFRLTGDLLEEKGKYKIMACRSSNREFLSWLKKEKHQPHLKRGQLVSVDDCENKSNELRPGTSYQLLKSLSSSSF